MLPDPPPRPKPRRPFFSPDFISNASSRPPDPSEEQLVRDIRSLYHTVARGPQLLESATRFVMLYMRRSTGEHFGVLFEWFRLSTPFSDLAIFVRAAAPNYPSHYEPGKTSFMFCDKADRFSQPYVPTETLRAVGDRARARTGSKRPPGNITRIELDLYAI